MFIKLPFDNPILATLHLRPEEIRTVAHDAAGQNTCCIVSFKAAYPPSGDPDIFSIAGATFMVQQRVNAPLRIVLGALCSASNGTLITVDPFLDVDNDGGAP